MKATGIVRRIDELGRVVIPKEIRRTLRIREGDPLEIFTDREGEVILKKYSPIGELGDFAKEYAESLHLALGHTALICDKDNVIAVAGASRRELLDRPLHDDVKQVMKRREKVLASDGNGAVPHITAEDGGDIYQAAVVVPILAAGDAIGAVILVSREAGAAMSATGAEQRAKRPQISWENRWRTKSYTASTAGRCRPANCRAAFLRFYMGNNTNNMNNPKRNVEFLHKSLHSC